ncbi:hypothetical protein [Brochothrix campestris]|uniref:Secreted protein n=1 Tax=Brochothrix campestris FSL F6-1037 TaxID=1265861 RepID=W7CLY7_9LIST|nr:hypothetical protein [Brochothrix campestris]EUJ38032.1 hypothetical protein BCAMP_09245 [Brochothrix campestris FSL F6-1037]
MKNSRNLLVLFMIVPLMSVNIVSQANETHNNRQMVNDPSAFDNSQYCISQTATGRVVQAINGLLVKISGETSGSRTIQFKAESRK